MRYSAAEKLEIIRLVEQSPLPVRHTLAKLGIVPATFYRWYDWHSRGSERSVTATGSRVEPHSGRRARQPHQAGTASPDTAAIGLL
jgi:transposase-like protein